MSKSINVLQLSVFVLFLSFLVFPLQANAVPGQGTLYGTSPDRLFIIDPRTGASTDLGVIARDLLPAQLGFPSLAIDPLTGTAFAGCGAGCNQIWTVDLDTAIGTVLGSLNGGNTTTPALDFRADGVLFASLNMIAGGASGGDHLATINTLTGEATVIGPYGICTNTCTIDGMEALAFDAEGNLWGALRTAPNSSGTPGLYLIDTNTGAATFVIPLLDENGVLAPTSEVVSLQFACDGTLYGGTPRTFAPDDGGFLVTINTNTGIVTFVSDVTSTRGASLGGLSFDQDCAGFVSPVPTISEWGLIATAGILGLVSLFILVRKRTRVASTY